MSDSTSSSITETVTEIVVRRILPAALLAVVGLTAWAVPTPAQQEAPQGDAPTTATLQGRVVGETGETLQGVSVYVATLERGTLTEADGRYRLGDLPARGLRVRFRMLGRETVVRTVRLEPGERRTLDVALSTSPLRGGEITVTGTPVAQDPLEVTQEVDVVGSEEITTRGSASLGGLLEETVPGVSSISTGSQAGKPVLRGLSGTRVRMLEDGVARDFFQYGVRHFPQTSLTQAERVEVVKGAASIQYGSDALGGAVNVITRDLPSSDDGEPVFGGRVRGQFFSNNEERAGSADLHGAVGPVGFRAGLQLRGAENVTTPDEPTFFDEERAGGATTGRFGTPKYTGELPFTNFDQASGYAQLGVDAGFGRAEVYASHWDNEHDFLLPTGGEPDNPDNPPPAGIGQNLEQTDVTAKATAVAGGFVLRPIANYSRALRQAAAPGTVIEDDPDFAIDLAKDSYTGRLEVEHPAWGRVSGSWGVEVNVQDTESRGPVELEPGSDVLNVGVFAFEELDVDPVTLSAGLRYDHREQEAEPNELTGDPALLDNQYDELTGGVGANLGLAEGLALAGNVNVGFRAPSIFELYANGTHGGVAAFQRGDPTLEPERSTSVDLSLRASTDRVRGKVTGYWNRIADYIFLSSTEEDAPSGLPIFEARQTDARVYGIDATVDVSVTPWLQAGGGFSVLGSEGDGIADPDDPASGDGPLPLLPADRVDGRLRFLPPETGRLRRPHLEVRVKHAFDKDAAGRLEPFSQFDGPGTFGTASTEAYTVVDLEAGTRLELGQVPFSVTVEVENLFDTVHRDFLDTYKGYALSPGRDVRTTISVPFGDHAGHP